MVRGRRQAVMFSDVVKTPSMTFIVEEIKPTHASGNSVTHGRML